MAFDYEYDGDESYIVITCESCGTVRRYGPYLNAQGPNLHTHERWNAKQDAKAAGWWKLQKCPKCHAKDSAKA